MCERDCVIGVKSPFPIENKLINSSSYCFFGAFVFGMHRLVVFLVCVGGAAGGQGWSSPTNLEELGIKVKLVEEGKSSNGDVNSQPQFGSIESDRGGSSDSDTPAAVTAKRSADGEEEEIAVPAVTLTHAEFEAANPMHGAREFEQDVALEDGSPQPPAHTHAG
jgi:hypothetical protein